MFGIYRYVLSWMVVWTHVRGLLENRLNWFGPFAVFAFYMLSGYLMTLVLRKHYGVIEHGLRAYLFNRFLRIYPPYWLALALSATLLCLDPRAATVASPFYQAPTDAWGWFVNVVLVGLHGDVIRVVAPAWTLSVEVLYYVAMALVLSRSRRTVVLWFAASIVYVLWRLVAGLPVYRDPSQLLAASLPFSLGALIHFIPARPLPVGVLPVAIMLFGINVVFANDIWPNPFDQGVCASLVLSGVLLHGLRCWYPASPRVRRLDATLGELAYPIFLVHMPVMGLLLGWGFDYRRPDDWTLLASLVLPVHVVAWAMHRFVVDRIEPLRSRIAGKA